MRRETVKRQIVVIGLGRFGSAIARTLHGLGHEVLAVDTDARNVQDLADEVTHAVQADGTDRDAMAELGVADFDAAVVAISSELAPSILTTLTLRDLGCRYIIAKAANDQHARILERIGADRVVFPERETGTRLAHTFAARAVLDYMDLGPGYGIAKSKPPAAFLGKALEELNLREQYGLTLIAVIHGGTEVVLHPRRDERLGPGDVVVVAGRDEDLERLQPS
ncbi:MAG: TrkA family potassium uptake protein [Chloroflexi bacterium]|nr:TrkA family potassium uptake protein [Chloroflexota bacterium]